MFKNAKIGDKVFDYTLQEWGYIKNTECLTNYPIFVEYANETKTYTIDGKDYYKAKTPTLFWDEVKPIIPPKKPLPNLEVDTKVLVWDNCDDSKYKRHFKEFNSNGKILCFTDGYTSWSNIVSTAGVPWDNWEIADD